MKYKILKDTPRLKAGSIGELSYTQPTYLKNSKEAVFFSINSDEGNTECFSKALVESSPDWFEPVIERWVGVSGEKYYFVYAAGDVGVSDCGEHKTYFNHGNYFKTQDQAIEASKRIKKCLMEYHKELGE